MKLFLVALLIFCLTPKLHAEVDGDASGGDKWGGSPFPSGLPYSSANFSERCLTHKSADPALGAFDSDGAMTSSADAPVTPKGAGSGQN